MKINWFKRSENPNDLLCVLERTAYASANTGSAWTYILLMAFITFYYTNVVGLDPATIGTIIAVSKVLDGISDLVVGILVDKTRTRMGKARPWILIMAIPHAIATVLAFSVPAGWTEAHQYIYVFATYNLVNTVTYTMTAVPIFTLNCLTTSNSEERTKSGIWMQIGANAVIFIVNATCVKMVSAFGDNGRAWAAVAVIYGVIGAVMMVFSALVTRERVVPAPEEASLPLGRRLKAVIANKYWWVYTASTVFASIAYSIMAAGTMYYCTDILGDTQKYSIVSSLQSVLSFVLLLVLMSWMVKKFGNVAVRQMSHISYIIASILLLVTTNWAVVIIGFALWGVGFACVTGAQGALLADMADYGGKLAGFDVSGVTNSAQSFVGKMSSGFGTAIMTWILAWFGYDGMAATQTTHALLGVKIAFCIAPIVAAIIAFLIMTQFDMYKKGLIKEGGRT